MPTSGKVRHLEEKKGGEMGQVERLQEGSFYHIFNRGNNRERIFRTAENYRFFLRRYVQYVEPVMATYAYCLLPNHFHLLVRVRTAEEQRLWAAADGDGAAGWQPAAAHEALRRLFISYGMAFNRRYDRTGSLFQKRFKRKRVTDDRYLLTLVRYIHQNPQRHGLVDDFREWMWSSYGAVAVIQAGDRPSRVQRAAVLDWFGSRAALVEAHETAVDGAWAELAETAWG